MADTKIEWTDKTWNPIVGCSVVSPGCTNCYAMKMAHRIQRAPKSAPSLPLRLAAAVPRALVPGAGRAGGVATGGATEP